MTQKTALITGATAGIGQAAARAFVDAELKAIADRVVAAAGKLGATPRT